MISTIVLPFLCSLAASLALVPACRWASVRAGYVAQPREDRWHRRSVALFGGVAMGVTLLIASIVFGVARQNPVLLVCAMLIFVMGLSDDVVPLKPSTKLVGQIALAAALVFFNFRLNWFASATLDTLLTLIWVVGMTTAFNLLDNMDGLCAGIALIVGAALLIDILPGAAANGVLGQATYLAILLGATAGFLAYNLHPASIFMGDSGSLLLGFSFGAVTLTSGHIGPGRSDVLSIVAAPVLVLLIPIFDTTLVTLSRWFSGRSASQGGRDHSSHRLVAIGLSERRAVLVLWLLAAMGGAIGVALEYLNQGWAALAGVGFLLGMAMFAVYLAGIRVYEEDDASIRKETVTPIIVEFMHKRRVAEVLLDFCLITACYYAAYRMRFEDPEEFMKNFPAFLDSLPVLLAAQLGAFFIVGVYRGVWRHFGMSDTVVIAKGVFFGVITSLAVIIFGFRFVSYSRTALAIYGGLLLIAVTLSRASFRLVGEFVQRQRKSGRRVAIYGADDAGGAILSQLFRQGDRDGVRVLGFIDDDPRKVGSRIAGYPVLGGFSALSLLVTTRSVDMVVIGTQLGPDRLHNLEQICSSHGVNLSRLTIKLEEIIVDESARPPAPPATVINFKSGS
jgi:UDP-GlcNAc:undecaprenyl-phosphate/decaprenyl-phosphate GlcNAc-1-phosphate transferase